MNSFSSNYQFDQTTLDAPVFYPTLDEFHDPISYINKIRPLSEIAGICKIVPPKDWNPPVLLHYKKLIGFPTKLQKLNNLDAETRYHIKYSLFSMNIYIFPQGRK